MTKTKKENVLPWMAIADTREKKPYDFEGITTRIDGEEIPLRIHTVRQYLATGDYSIAGMHHLIAIERKSIRDLLNTIAQHRERFIKLLVRMSKLEFGAIVVEGEWKRVQKCCCLYTQMDPRSLDSSILAWNQRYQNVHWYFRPDRTCAQKTVWKILDRFYKDKVQRDK